MHRASCRWPDEWGASRCWVQACPQRFNMALLAVLVAGVMVLPSKGHAACHRPRGAAVKVSSEMAEISVKTDYSIADLARMAGTVSQDPPHRVLGFYANAIGFRLHMPGLNTGSCANLLIEVQLVTTQGVIELARDIADNPCLFGAALRHYRHHAGLQAYALAQSGRVLEPALQRFVTDALSSNAGGRFRSGMLLDDQIRAFVGRWLDGFRKTVPAIQAAADSPAELQALRDACFA